MTSGRLRSGAEGFARRGRQGGPEPSFHHPATSGRSNCCVVRTGQGEQCFICYQYFVHLYDLVDSEFIYVPNSARDVRRAPPVRPGGKDMAIAQSTPAKAKKMTVASVLKQIETEKIRWIDLQFVDVLGALQHITIPATSLGNEEFNRGVGKLDGSSIKGFKEIHESDMVMNPDPSTFAVLPWYEGEHRTARFLVDVYEGGSHERFTRDSRYMAQRAVQFAADQGYDTTYWGREIEFFVFDGIRLLPSADAARNPWAGAGYEILSREAPWGQSSGTNFPIRFKEGYYPAPPVDSLQDFRNEACRVLIDDFGLTLDAHHHEVATAGQCEIDMRYDELVPMADNVVTYRYVMKMVAHKMGMMATFMPKPIFGDNASGMHVDQSLWTKGKNLLYDPKDEYAEISQTCRYYIGGLMEHARSLCAFTNPTTNSYRRLVPGYEAPVFIAWSKRNRSANIRIPMYYQGIEAAKRIEYRTPALAIRVLSVHGRLNRAALGPSHIHRRPRSSDDEMAESRSKARVRLVHVQPSNTAPGAGLARQASMASIQVFLDNWFVRHLGSLKTTMRVIFGVVWTIDGAFKFQPGFADSLAQMISDAGQGQPSWLQPWFAFWSQTVGANPGFFITTIGALELALGFALLLGFMRKVAYTAGIFLSLIIWSVPEGFGGPYGPSSTDIGTGIIYAFVFLLLMIINAAFGPSRWSLDYAIERRWPAWKKVSAIRSAA